LIAAYAIVLVDDASKPMLDAAQSLLRSATASGHEHKLITVFTHFDQMDSDNFNGAGDVKDAVLSSLQQAIQGVEEALGAQSGAGRRLRQALEDKVLFVGHIQEAVPKGNATRAELRKLIELLNKSHQYKLLTDAVPGYDLADLIVRVWPATSQFQKQWNALLNSQHWTRIRALSRRFADQTSDGYDTLQPVADLRGIFVEQLGHFISDPREWTPINASSKAKDDALSRVRIEFSNRLGSYVERRLKEETLSQWRIAYERSGPGSGTTRAKDVRSINEDVAPVPDEVSPQLLARLLDGLRTVFREAAAAAGARVVNS